MAQNTPGPEIPVVVQSRREIARDVVRLDIATPDGSPLPAWAPGAHVDLVLDNGMVRQYSLCGDPGDRASYSVAVLHEADGLGGSSAIHAGLQEGTALRFRGPRNHFPLQPSPRYLFIAGGIGITPIRAMIEDVRRRGATWALVYGGRTLHSMAFADDFKGLDQVQVLPQDETGHIPVRELLGRPTEGTLVYCCGPEPLLRAVEEACHAWPSGSLKTERFTAKEQAEGASSNAFDVQLTESDRTVRVGSDETILAALTTAGVDVPYSCEDGVCGSCETFVLEGQPDHRDSVMTPEEHDSAGTMQVCVSRCLGDRLVLEL